MAKKPQQVNELRTESGDALYDDTNDALIVGGVAASFEDEAGNPVQIGGSVDLSYPEVATEGKVRRITSSARGRMLIAATGNTTGIDAASNTYSALVNSGDEARPSGVFTWGLAPDGLWDRIRTAGDTANKGLGALMTSPTGHAYQEVDAGVQILASSGKLHTITIHDCTTGGTITVYDNPAEEGTVIATLVLAAGEGFVSLHYDVACTAGLYIGWASAVAKLTVSYAD